VECAGEVLSLLRVDPGLATDRGVDHADERRRHGKPPHAAQMSRGDEAGDISRRSTADAGDPPVTPDRQLTPQTLYHLERLRGLAARDRVCG
jgi:hypothetical protein